MNQCDVELETEVCPMKFMNHWHLTSHLVFLDNPCVRIYRRAASSVKRSDTIFGDCDEQGWLHTSESVLLSPNFNIQAPSPPAALEGFHFNADPNRRGAAATSNTRAHLWISQQNQGHPTGRATLPAALVSHAALSGIGTYKTTFATLAAISFLGALG